MASQLTDRIWFNALWFQAVWLCAVLGRDSLLPLAVLLLASARLRVTVLAPTSEQVNALTSRLLLLTAQLSEEPLSMSLVVMLALPLPSR